MPALGVSSVRGPRSAARDAAVSAATPEPITPSHRRAQSAYGAWQFENTECLQPPLSMEVADGTPSGTADAIIVNYERLANMVPSLPLAHRMKLGANGIYGAACLALGPACGGG